MTSSSEGEGRLQIPTRLEGEVLVRPGDVLRRLEEEEEEQELGR